MANPALKRSGDTENERNQDGTTRDESTSGIFAAHTTGDLIALRDRLLEECLDLESRVGDPAGVDLDPKSDPMQVREKIDEIHQELALRDLAERVRPPGSRAGGDAEVISGLMPGDPGFPAHAARKSVQILEAIEMRSRFMDELARTAREEGRLDQAATFTINAQKLDMERVQVLRQLSALSTKAAGTDD